MGLGGSTDRSTVQLGKKRTVLFAVDKFVVAELSWALGVWQRNNRNILAQNVDIPCV